MNFLNLSRFPLFSKRPGLKFRVVAGGGVGADSSNVSRNILENSLGIDTRVVFAKAPCKNRKNPLSPLYYGLTRLTLLAVVFLSASTLCAEDSKVFYPTDAPDKILTPSGGSNPIATSILYLVFLGAAGAVAYVFWKRKNTPTCGKMLPEQPVNIVSTRPLGNRQFLVVVRHKEKELLLGVGQGFINKLSESAASNDVDKNNIPVASKPEKFSKILRHAKKGRGV